MTSINLTVDGAHVQACVTGPVTTGMVGIPVTIHYSDVWEGLTKTLVCKGGGCTRSISGITTKSNVAPEVLRAGATLYLGIEGRNADGTLVIPTIWADCGTIQEGALSNGDPSLTEDNPVWTQLQQQIGAMDDLETQDARNLVDAVNGLHTQVEQLLTQPDPIFTDIGSGVYQNGGNLYLNPPMATQKEYATTEHWLSSVVYRKLIYLGPLSTAGSTQRKKHLASIGTLIGCRGIIISSDGSLFGEVTFGSSEASVYVSGEYIYWKNIQPMTSLVGYVELKYIK